MEDKRIQHIERMVGANHPTREDTLNRLMMSEHNIDGTHDEITANDLILKSGPWFDVKAYGAVGDGVTDDTVALQLVFNTIPTGGRGVTIYFPAGDYKITAPIVYSGQANFRIVGHRRRDSIWRGSTLKASSTINSFFNFEGSDFYEIEDMGFDGDALAVNGIKMGFTSGAFHPTHIFIKRVTVQNITGTAIDTGSTTGYQAIADSVIEDIIIETAAVGINIGAQAMKINRGTIAGCTEAGIKTKASSSANCSGVIFTGNSIDIKYSGNDTIAEYGFDSCWFENSTSAIFKRPDTPSGTANCSPIYFKNCHLHTLGSALLDFTNVNAQINIDGGKWDSTGNDGTISLPVDSKLYINTEYSDQIIYSGTGSTIVYKPTFNYLRCRAFLDATTQSVSGSQWTKVELNGETFDSASKFDNVTNFRFQPGIKGFYSISGKVQINSTEQDKQYIVALQLSSTIWASSRVISSVSSSTIDVPINDIIEITDTAQYIELFVYHDAVSLQNIVNGTSVTYMSIHRLS